MRESEFVRAVERNSIGREVEDDSVIVSTPWQVEDRMRLNFAGRWIELRDSGGLNSAIAVD